MIPKICVTLNHCTSRSIKNSTKFPNFNFLNTAKQIVPYETTAAKEFQRGMVTPQTQELELPHKNPPFTPDYK